MSFERGKGETDGNDDRKSRKYDRSTRSPSPSPCRQGENKGNEKRDENALNKSDTPVEKEGGTPHRPVTQILIMIRKRKMGGRNRGKAVMGIREEGRYPDPQPKKKGDKSDPDTPKPLTKKDWMKTPTFNGLTPWRAFHEKFQDVCEYNGWDEKQKKYFLKEALTGQAEQLIWESNMEGYNILSAVFQAPKAIWV